jgi:adenylate kinase family enzyme
MAIVLAEKRLAFLASTGVGKTTVVRHLLADPRLAAHLVVDIDFFFPKEVPQEEKEGLAVRLVLDKEVDVVFSVMTDPGLRTFLAERGFSFTVLSLPESEHRARLAKRSGKARRSLMGIEESVAAQRHLEGLGYETIDANRRVEEVARDVRRMLYGLGAGEKLAVLAAPGVGKATLSRRLRAQLAVIRDSRFKAKLILNSEPFLLRVPGVEKLGALEGEEWADGWRRAERRAVEATIGKKVDALFGLMSTSSQRAVLEENGFELVVLSLPDSLHRQRMERRFWERGKVVNIDASTRRQRKLEGLGYGAIDASRPADVVADEIVAKILSLNHSSEPAPSPVGPR